MYNDSFRKRYSNAPVAISSTENFNPTRSHIHNEIELLCIVKGSSEIQISNQTYRAHSGDLYFINPLEAHSIIVDHTEPYCHRCICFDRSLIVDKKLSDDLQQGYRAIPHCFSADLEITQKLTVLFEQLYAAVKEDSPSLLFDAAATISLFFSRLITGGMLGSDTAWSKQAEFCAKVTNYIALHYPEAITSKEVARALFYTQSYFCRSFKRNFGVSFSEYLCMYRLLIAKNKLTAENKKVGAVAAECGFGSANHFAACFKKTFGITPLRYQKGQHSSKI